MATGDLHNNLQRLKQDLRGLKYPAEVDTDLATQGDPAAFLPIIHHILLGASELLQKHLAESGVDLYAKSDRQFIGAVYKLLITVFKYKPLINQTQFFDVGFAEHKVLFCTQLIKICEKKTNDLLRLEAAERSRKMRHDKPPTSHSAQRLQTPKKRGDYSESQESWSREMHTNTSGASVRVFESPEVPPRLNSSHPFYAHVSEVSKEDDVQVSDSPSPSTGVILKQLAQNIAEMHRDLQRLRDDFEVFRENTAAHLALNDNQIRMLSSKKNEELLEYALSRAEEPR